MFAACNSVTCGGGISCSGKIRQFGMCHNGDCTIESENCKVICSIDASTTNFCAKDGVMFVTGKKWGGNLGGISGADEKCQDSATKAGLSGKWIALLSDSKTNAFDRVPNTLFIRMDGNRIANGKWSLFKASIIENPISITETGETVSGNEYVWTGTQEEGVKAKSSSASGAVTFFNCSNWSDSTGQYSGEVGRIKNSNSMGWVDSNSLACDINGGLRLYCVMVSS